MEFADIIDDLLECDRFHRLEWPQDGTYICIRDDKLMIFKPEDKTFHPLILSVGDRMGDDWEVHKIRLVS